MHSLKLVERYRLMKFNDSAFIVKGLNEKIKLLNEYEAITQRMVDTDLDEITNLIALRQIIIQKIDSIMSDINEVISRQSKKEQAILNDILSHKEADNKNEYKLIQEAMSEVERILVRISSEEQGVVNTMEKIKLELEDEMLKSNKGKQVLDYFSSFASYNIKGRKLDSIT